MSRRTILRGAFVLASTFSSMVLFACSLLTGASELEKAACVVGCDDSSTTAADADGAPPGSSDATVKLDGALFPDASTEPDGSAVPDAAARCKGLHGATPVRVGSFCIDETEATGDHYVEFLNSAGTATDAGLPECAFNTTFVPSSAWPRVLGELQKPVQYVDWCDAYEYCRWAGKRLCGAIGGGGAIAPAIVTNPASSEWASACTSQGANEYPYGPTFTAGTCNMAGTVVPPKNFPLCKTPAGVYDLLGNVEEWVNSCSGTIGAADDCSAIAVSFTDNDKAPRVCSQPFKANRNASRNTVGIRCCSDLE